MLAKEKAQKAGRVLPEPQQVGDVLTMVMGKVSKGLKSLDAETALSWSGHDHDKKLHGAIEALCQVLLRGATGTIDKKVVEWCRFYREIFGLDLDPSEIRLPEERKGFGWIVLVAKGLTYNYVFEKCETHFNGEAWRYCADLDKAVTMNDRESTETYAIRVRDRIEADEEHKNKSANMVTKEGVKGMTGLERMLLELWYHWKTRGDHLDRKTSTICSGSRYADCNVPSARWFGGRFIVGGVLPDDRGDDWRVRETVSLPRPS